MNLPEARILRREDHQISREDIDPDALKVLYRLHSRGFRAFLVGGGVRDLLLGRTPKDYDIGTDARPAEVLKLFRNSRVIGRRFPIVHILLPRRKFIEVATFRALEEEVGDAEGEEEERLLEEADRLLGGDPPSGEEAPPLRKDRRPSPLEISKRQNYGSPAEDALRRDLTVNGLFYDIADFCVIDYVGGLEDLEKRIIRSIGDAETRFRDDPVRMIRAARHAARIGFQVEEETWKAIL
ncbi:MAG: poly(A) polymerase, partial [Candidatus Krumholzibacteria bacterium]|nr:poly(A) polymerase [Candidatus Krumholzibacteria bacterium]